MLHAFSRTELLLGKPALAWLRERRVAVFGIGGVGAYTVEALARAGIGRLLLVDDDRVCLTNLNRQLQATRRTIGRSKVEVMRERVLDINPDAEVTVQPCFVLPDNAPGLVTADLDYVVDAVDTVAAKLALVQVACERGIPVISAMGAGNKLDPSRLEIADLAETSVCPLAKVMRKELRKRGITSLKVVYSREEPLVPEPGDGDGSCRTACVCPPGTLCTCVTRRQVPGSISFVPSVAGLLLAGEVIRDLLRAAPPGVVPAAVAARLAAVSR